MFFAKEILHNLGRGPLYDYRDGLLYFIYVDCDSNRLIDRMTSMHITYLIGAGASCAIAPKNIPGMQMLASMAEYFPKEIEKFKKLLVETGIYKEFIFPKDLIRPGNTMPENISKLNIEKLLQELEDVASWGTHDQAGAADLAHNLIQSLLTRLFSRLNSDFVSKTEKNPYDLLAAAIAADRHGHKHHFISFNYDVWLEQALQRHGLWNPVNGYLSNNVNPLPIRYLASARTLEHLPSNEPSPTLVLKPHGSLSWLTPQDDPYGIPTLLLDKDGLAEGGKHTLGAPTYLPPGTDSVEITHESKRQKFAPLIIPPVLNKAVGGEFLYKVHKAVQREFESSDAVVIIGWSMPPTDASIRQRIADGLAPRSDSNNLKWLITCNFMKTDLFYNRYRATIPAKRSSMYDDGFGAGFIGAALSGLWENR